MNWLVVPHRSEIGDSFVLTLLETTVPLTTQIASTSNSVNESQIQKLNTGLQNHSLKSVGMFYGN